MKSINDMNNNNDMMDKIFGCFKENQGFVSERGSVDNLENISKEQLKIMNISEHNRLEAYFSEFFEKNEYKDMPFYQLAQILNHRNFQLPRFFFVDIYKEKNVGIITVTCLSLTIVPEILDLMTKCKASILANAFGRVNEMMLTLTCKLIPKDEDADSAK